MIKFDYHTHSHYSPDSFARIEDMASHAIKCGITELGISDHFDFFYPDGELANPGNVSKYISSIKKAQKKFEGKLKILVGAEFGLRRDAIATATDIAKNHDFDYIIGSMHEHSSGYGYHSANFFGSLSKERAYRIYFENMLQVVNDCDCFDVIGHLDYIERYGRYADKSLVYKDYADVIDELLKAIIAKGKGIELNTAGYSYGLGHPHPQLNILRRYRELGGEILTVGSDSHRPDSIGQYFNKAAHVLEEAGIKYITSFKSRKPKMIKL